MIRLAQKVWRQCVLVFAHDFGFRGGKCNGLLANTGLFLSTGNRYLFLLQRWTIPFDSLSLLLIQFSHAGRQSFVTEVSDKVLSWSDSRILNLYRLSKISWDGFFDIDNRTSSHLVSNSPDSPRVQCITEKYTGQDFCSKLVHSRLVFRRKKKGDILPLLQTVLLVRQRAFRTAFHMVSSRQTRDLECFADSSSIPWNPPTIRYPDRTAKAPQMSLLLSLCALLFQQSHLFLICVVLTYYDSRIVPRKTCQIPRNCQ